jgi:hypothetical protein
MAITKMSNSGIASTGSEKYNDMLAGNAPFLPAGYVSLATYTAAGGESLITMSGIPGGYSSLIVRISAQITAAFANNNGLRVKLNGDSGTNYQYNYIDSYATAVQGAASAGTTSMPPNDCFPSTFQTNNFGAAILTFPDYATTTKFKPMTFYAGMNDSSSGIRYNRAGGALWSNTSAITSITFEPQYTFGANSTFSLYGVK